MIALVDRGGDLADILGTRDDVFGDEDDRDVDFAEDIYSAGSGIHGVEDQPARAAFALSGPTDLFADGFESGDTSLWR